MESDTRTPARTKSRPIVGAIVVVGLIVLLIGRFTMPFQPLWMDFAFIVFCVIFVAFLKIAGPLPKSKGTTGSDERAP